MTYSDEYRIWWAMVNRSTNPRDPAYGSYGGRGIDMDPRWRVFASFYADVGARPRKGLTLERIDNNKGYWPENVCWATQSAQNLNRRAAPPKPNGEDSPRAVLTWGEVREIRTKLQTGKTMESLAREYGISPSNVRAIKLEHTWKERAIIS